MPRLFTSLDEATEAANNYVQLPIIQTGRERVFYIVKANVTAGYAAEDNDKLIMVPKTYFDEAGIDPAEILYTANVGDEELP